MMLLSVLTLSINVARYYYGWFDENEEDLTKHPLGVPLPPVLHQNLNETFLNSFHEVLVIGDVHGCYDELMEMLTFKNSKNCLKIFVGDLVNKGPKSKEVLDYVMTTGKATTLAVRGNHEEKVIKKYLEYKSGHPLSKKYKWIKSLTDEHVQFLISLPFTIKIPSLNAIVVHAGLIPGQALQHMSLIDLVTMRNIVFTGHPKAKVIKATEDTDEGDAWAKHWTGPLHVYFGHDARRKLQTYPFATGLDTGCVSGNHLTGLFIKGTRKGHFRSIKAKRTYKD